jgi:diaminopimelate epimerase
VWYLDDIDSLDLDKIGPDFENASIFPSESTRVCACGKRKTHWRMRVFERGNGETWACGTGACAAVIAATERDFLKRAWT